MISLHFLLRLITATNLLAQTPLVNPLALTQPWERATGSLDDFISSESHIALQGVLNNIGYNGASGPAGAKVSVAAPGLVVASPSKANPDCKWF